MNKFVLGMPEILVYDRLLRTEGSLHVKELLGLKDEYGKKAITRKTLYSALNTLAGMTLIEREERNSLKWRVVDDLQENNLVSVKKRLFSRVFEDFFQSKCKREDSIIEDTVADISYLDFHNSLFPKDATEFTAIEHQLNDISYLGLFRATFPSEVRDMIVRDSDIRTEIKRLCNLIDDKILTHYLSKHERIPADIRKEVGRTKKLRKERSIPEPTEDEIQTFYARERMNRYDAALVIPVVGGRFYTPGVNVSTLYQIKKRSDKGLPGLYPNYKYKFFPKNRRKRLRQNRAKTSFGN